MIHESLSACRISAYIVQVSEDLMSYIHSIAREVIYHRLVRSTPIIRQIYALETGDPGKRVLSIYVVSDGGKWDTVIPKLIRRFMEEVEQAIEKDSPRHGRRVSWFHAKGAGKAPPEGAQIVFTRWDLVRA